MGLSLQGINLINVAQEIRKGWKEFRPLCPVKLQGVTCKALIDGGNTVHPCINEDFAKEIFGSRLKDHLKDIPSNMVIGTAKEGASLTTLGMTRRPLSLRLGGHGKVLQVHPLVIRGLNSRMNISGTFLTHHRIDHLYSQGALRFQGKLIKLLPLTRDVIKSVVKIPSSSNRRDNSAGDKKSLIDRFVDKLERLLGEDGAKGTMKTSSNRASETKSSPNSSSIVITTRSASRDTPVSVGEKKLRSCLKTKKSRNEPEKRVTFSGKDAVKKIPNRADLDEYGA